MTSASLCKFLKALENVKTDYMCGVCSQYCKDPVTLSKCFHIICSEHFDELKVCPVCKTDLEGCKKFIDPGLSTCIDSAKELDIFFQNYISNLSRITEVASIAERATSESNKSYIPDITEETARKSSKNTKNAENPSTLKGVSKKLVSASKKDVLSTKANTSDVSSSKKTVIIAKNLEKDVENSTNRSTMAKRQKIDATKSTSAKDLSKNYEKDTTNTSTKENKINKQEKLVRSDSNLSKKSIIIKNELKDPTETKVTRNKKQNIDTTSDSSKKLGSNKALELDTSRNITNASMPSNKFNKINEKRNNKGETLLHIACRLGNVDRVIELLEQGANPNTKDNAGWTPLHEIVQNGRLDLVRILLQYNTLIDVPGQSNETPLHEAIRYNHPEIAEELIKHGANMNAHNCKGETPYQLASADMKTTLLAAAENIVQTQSLNVTHMSLVHSELDFDDIRVFCISEFRTVHIKLKMLAKAHSNVTVEPKYNKKVTHLIVDADDGVCTSSLDVLQGIVSSLWILSTDWIIKSTEGNLEAFSKYEIVGVGNKSYNGPRNSRYNKYKQLPGIFDGCHFYLHDFNSKYEISKSLILTKASLSKLITDTAGVVLRRAPNPELIPDQEKLVPYHAKKGGKLVNCSHYIIYKDIYQPMYNMQHLKALPIGWLIECIEKYELCEPW